MKSFAFEAFVIWVMAVGIAAILYLLGYALGVSEREALNGFSGIVLGLAIAVAIIVIYRRSE